MNFLKTVIAGTFLIASTLTVTAGSEPSLKPVLDASVQVGNFCSGTAVDTKDGIRILTAEHCVKSGPEYVNIRVRSYNKMDLPVSEHVYYAAKSKKSWTADIAVFELLDATADIPTLPIAALPDLQRGSSKLLVVGHPAGRELMVTEGRYAGREAIPFPKRTTLQEYLRISTPAIGGNSGGAVVAVVNGEWQIVGVLTAGLRSYHHYSMAVSYNEINKFIDRATHDSVFPHI